MMLGTNSSSLVGNSAAEAAAAAAVKASDGGGGGEVGGAGTNPSSFSDEDEARIEVGGGGGGGGGGNRWPRQETLELLRIRSEMEAAFRDSNLKGPLWEEVSRKMSQLGYQRSAKKCKEKFENVHKYHKRTKESRAAKSDGKTYRFFDQLEALEKNPSSLPSPHPPMAPPRPQPQAQAQIPITIPTTSMAASAMAVASSLNTPTVSSHVSVSLTPVAAAASSTTNPPISSNITVSLAPADAALPISFSPSLNNNPLFSTTLSSSQSLPNNPPHGNSTFESPHQNVLSSSLPSDFTSSSTSSDEDIRRRHKRKRKIKDYFERLSQNMMDKQEELHKQFLEALETRERERMIREEAWRVQEMARMNRELDLLNQERTMTAAKDAAVMTFLQKFTAQEQNPQIPSYNIHLPSPQLPQNSPPLPPQPQPVSALIPQKTPPASASASVPAPEIHAQALSTRNEGTLISDNGGENFMGTSSSRWPKVEIEALIKLRTNLDMKYQENGPKGPLWEEISAGMRKLGYYRSAKRCKEKWENINKYFKKVKESNKKRQQDSRTCPYFHTLDALYQEKGKADATNSSQISYANSLKPENLVPIMARPEQQWPIPQQESALDDDDDRENQTFDEDENEEEEEEDEEEGGGGYEIVTNRRQDSVSVATATTSAAE